MFKLIKPTLIESDEGFSVNLLDGEYMNYSEGDHKLKFNIEILASPAGYALYKQSIKGWQAPYNAEDIDDVKRERIIQNVERALRFANYQVEIDNRKLNF
jgi:hypothetical protein